MAPSKAAQLQQHRDRLATACAPFAVAAACGATIHPAHAGTILRAAGLNPAEAHVQALAQLLASLPPPGPPAADAAAADETAPDAPQQPPPSCDAEPPGAEQADAAEATTSDAPPAGAASAPAQPGAAAAGGGSEGGVPIEQFLALAAQFAVDNGKQLGRDDFHMLLRAFRAFDPQGRGWLEAAQLADLLGSAAAGPDALAPAEVEAALGFAADPATGRVYYEEYALRLACHGKPV